MGKRYDRLACIAEIIKTQQIGNQEELIKVLRSKGYDMTQATLSRDLKVMNVAKVADINGYYAYKVMDDTVQRNRDVGIGEANVEFSGNIGVVKTKAGYASGLALDIDSMNSSHIIGTIAGDDTILVVMKEGAKREDVREELRKLGIRNQGLTNN